MPGVFQGFTVVELGDRRNQLVGKIMSDSGARVIQVEPIAGSTGRWSGPFVDDKEDPDRCLDYWWNNTGKQSIQIDITRKPGQELLRRLLGQADVFVESTKPGTLRHYGLDYESLAAKNPRLIYTSVTDFGQGGPWADLEMNDPAHMALGGPMGLSGYSNQTEPPIGGHRNQAYSMAAVISLHTIAGALFERMDSDQGQYLDVSIHDCTSASTEWGVPHWLWYNEAPLRQTGQHASPTYRPSSQVQCADGRYVQITAANLNNNSWVKMVQWMEKVGVAGELADPKWRDDFYRADQLANGTAIHDGVMRLLSKVTAHEAFLGGQSLGLTWAVVRAPEENMQFDHYKERRYWAEVEQPEIGKTILYPRGFFVSDDLGSTPTGRAPHLGEHTRSILRDDLGIEDAEIDALTSAGVIGDSAIRSIGRARTHSIPTTAAPARASVRIVIRDDRRASVAPDIRPGFLSGLRVLDCSWHTVGPWATRMLSPYGAEVIHIEAPHQPDGHRYRFRRTNGAAMQKEWHEDGTPPYYTAPHFSHLQNGKLAISLNARHPEGKVLFERLIGMSDAFAENFSSDVMESWGLGWERLHEINPRLVYMSTAGFGHTGEWRSFRTYGSIAQASSGLSLTSGLPGRPPAGWGYSHMDVTGGWIGGVGLMMALLQARRTGMGLYVDYAVTEGSMGLLGTYFLDYQVNGRSTLRPDFPPGNHSEWPAIAPHNTYRAAGIDRQGQDWWVFIACETDQQFESLSYVMGKPELVSDARFATMNARVAHQAELDEIISTWTAPRRRYDIMETLQDIGVIAAVVQGVEDRVDYDPQLRHRGMYQVVSHPEIGDFQIERFPPRMSRTPAQNGSRGPMLREHEEYVYGELLGLGSHDITRLRADGVI